MRKSGESRMRSLKRTAGRSLLALVGTAYEHLSRWIPGPEPHPSGEPRVGAGLLNILVVNLLRIGDTVVATPAIHAIKDTFPKAHLTVVVRPMIRPLLASDPAIDELVSPSPRLHGRHFDLAIVLDTGLLGNLIAWFARARRRIGYDSFGRGFLLTEPVQAPGYWNTAVWDYRPEENVRHQVDSWLDLVERAGIRPCRRDPQLFVSSLAREKARKFIEQSKVKATDLKIALHPGSSPSYQWRPERFASVADALSNHYDAKIFITGSRQDGSLAGRIASMMSTRATIAAGIEGLDFLIALISEMDLVISVDTCATHIGSAVGVPVIALFGPGDPQIWRPYGPRDIVLRAEDSECLGCKRARCFREAHFCMDGITVETVIAAADQKLRLRKPTGSAR